MQLLDYSAQNAAVLVCAVGSGSPWCVKVEQKEARVAGWVAGHESPWVWAGALVHCGRCDKPCSWAAPTVGVGASQSQGQEV